MLETGTPEAIAAEEAAESLAEESVECAEEEPSVEEVLERAILEKARDAATPKEGLSQGWLILFVTLALFFGTDLLSNSVMGVLVIIAALFIHEMGHFVGMLLFGYKDVQMFFIPFFGAAVAGKSLNAPGWQRAVVSLMGPVPGIFLGFAAGVAYLVTKNVLLGHAAYVLIVLNAFNLLPLLPLDGGRFFFELLFRRNRHAEFVVRSGTAVLLAAMAFTLGSWIFGVLAFILFLSLGPSWKVASAAHELREKGIITPDAKTGDIPDDQLVEVIRCMRRHVPEVTDPGALSNLVRDVWQRLAVPPPGCLASILLAGVYGGTFLCVLAGPIIAVGLTQELRIVVVKGENGESIKMAQAVSLGAVQRECPLDDGGKYHGEATYYWPFSMKKATVGPYLHGRRHGLWRHFDREGSLTKEETFKEGRLVKRKFREGSGKSGPWVTRALSDLPAGERFTYEREAAASPKGPPREWP